MTSFISICIKCGATYTGDLKLNPCACGGSSFSSRSNNPVFQRTWEPLNAQNTPLNAQGVSVIPSGILSTSDDEKSPVDKIKPMVRKNPFSSRGRKSKKVPVKLINKLAREGLGSKAIATVLKQDGYDLSYKTIQRELAGERRN